MNRRRLLLIAFALIAAYGALGHLGVPYWLEAKLPSLLKEELGREVRLGETRFNPWRFTLDAQALEIDAPEGDSWIAIGAVFANFEPSALLRGVFRIAELRLDDPGLFVRRDAQGNFGVEDLLAGDEAPAETDESEPPVIEIGALRILGFEGQYVDETQTPVASIEFGPLNFELNGFSTEPDSESGLYSLAGGWNDTTLRWEGSFNASPLQSAGHIELVDLALAKLSAFAPSPTPRLASGSASFSGDYTLASAEEVVLQNAALTLEDLSLESGQRINRIELRDVSVDSSSQEARIGELRITEPTLAVARDKAGALDFGLGPSEPSEPDAADEPAAEPNPWTLALAAADLEGGHFSWSDHSAEPSAEVTIHELNATAENFVWPPSPEHAVETTLTAKIQKSGQIALAGPIQLEPLGGTLHLTLEGIAAPEFQALIDRSLQASIDGGVLRVEGDLRFDTEGARGTAAIDLGPTKVRTRSGETLLALHGAQVTQLAFDTVKQQYDLERLSFTRPDLRLVRDSSGVLNTDTLSAPNQIAAPAASSAEPGPRVSIATTAVSGGRLRFRDKGTTPPFETRLAALSGTVRGITSDDPTRAQVDLQGKLDGQGEVKITGTLRNLSRREDTSLQAQFTGIGLRPFSTYAQRYVGRPVDGGSLTLELDYRLEDRVFRGEHQFLLDQFTLGERVESPDATKLPVQLALALLRDRKGAIDVALPVRGDLDDPEFSYGGVVLKALVNLITKIAASPLSLLGNLVPGANGEAPEQISFAPGSAELDEASLEQLRVLAKALVERPALAIDVVGSAGSADGVAPGDELTLAAARGEAVVQALTEFGLERERTNASEPAQGPSAAAFSIRAR